MYLAAQSQDWFPTSVQVTALQARGLRIKGKNGTNDAYAMMQVAKDKYCTSVAEKSVAPVWREEATFDLPPSHRGDAERCTLRVHVMHRALVGPDKLLGQAAVHLLELDRVKSPGKSEWFKLLSKAGKPDKDRGEVLLDIQFMRNNMTASMFDLSAAGKPRSRLGKFKDRVRGKKKEGLSDTTCVVLPTLSQVLTDSEDERDRDGYCEGIAEKEEKKKHKLKNLFSPKSNLQRNMSQSMSVLGSLPQKNSLSSSHVSGLNAEPTEVKKKFKLKLHNHSSSSDTSSSQGLFHILGYPKQGPSPAAEQSNLCINGSHIYCEEPRPRSSTFSLPSVDHPSMEDIHKRQTFESSATSSNSFGALDQQLTSTEEEDGSKAADVKIVEEEEMVKITGMRTVERRMNIEEGEERKGHRMADEKKTVNRIGEEKGIVCEEIEKRWQKEEEKHDFKHERTGTGEEEIKGQHERARIMVNRTVEQRNKREEEEEESKRLVKEQGRQEKLERRKTEEEEMIKREVQERNRMQEERAEEERKKRKAKEEEDKRLAQEQMRLIELERGRMEDEEKVKRDEQEKIRMDQERAEEEMRERVRKEEAEQVMKEAEERERFTEEQKRLEEQEHRRVEKNERDKQKFSRMEEEKAEVQKKERERKEEEESKKLLEEQRKQEELERKGFEEEEQNKREEQERIRLEEKAAEEQRNKRKQEEERIRKEEEGRERLTLEQKRQEELERRCIEEEKFRREETEKIMTEKSRAEEQKKKIEEERERLAGRQSRQEAPGSPRKLEELQIKREEEERAGKFWKEDRMERIDEEERMREEELLRGERAKKLSREEEEILKEGKLRKHIEENVEKGGMENASRVEDDGLARENEQRQCFEERKIKEDIKEDVQWDKSSREQGKNRSGEQSTKEKSNVEEIRFNKENGKGYDQRDNERSDTPDRTKSADKSHLDPKIKVVVGNSTPFADIISSPLKDISSSNPFEEITSSPTGPLSTTAIVSTAKPSPPSCVIPPTPFVPATQCLRPIQRETGALEEVTADVLEKKRRAPSPPSNNELLKDVTFSSALSQMRTCSRADGNDPDSTQLDKRPAPQPPGWTGVQGKSQTEHSVSKLDLAPMNKQRKGEAKTSSALPQRVVQMIAPLMKPSSTLKDESSMQCGNHSQSIQSATGKPQAASHKGPAPTRPHSSSTAGKIPTQTSKDDPLQKPKRDFSSDDNRKDVDTSHGHSTAANQFPVVSRCEDDGNSPPFAHPHEVAISDHQRCLNPCINQNRHSVNAGLLDLCAPAHQSSDEKGTSETKTRSSKMARAPPPPANNAATPSVLVNRSTDPLSHRQTDVTVVVIHDTAVNRRSCPTGSPSTPPEPQGTPASSSNDPSQPEALRPVKETLLIVNSLPSETRPVAGQGNGEETSGRWDGSASASTRPHLVKPLNPLEHQPASVIQGSDDRKSAAMLGGVQEGIKVKRPYCQLTREELISLVLDQQSQLSERDKKISELEQYIDNLLLRVIEEKPSILMSLSSVKRNI